MPADLFRTRDHVPDFDDQVAGYRTRSARTRAMPGMMPGLRYGPGEGETLDLFFPASAPARPPVHMFIHGGYWRMFCKEDFSFVADTVTAAGAVAAVIDYALMPAVRLHEIVAQVRAAGKWLAAGAGRYGWDATRLTVSGHSAGAHLAALLFSRDQQPSGVAGALLLGGVYDLAPLQHSFLEPLIGLTDDEVRAWSPLAMRFEAGIDVTVAHGERETRPFHEQAAAFAGRLGSEGCRVALTALAGADHMSAAGDLGVPGSEAGRLLSAMIARH